MFNTIGLVISWRIYSRRVKNLIIINRRRVGHNDEMGLRFNLGAIKYSTLLETTNWGQLDILKFGGEGNSVGSFLVHKKFSFSNTPSQRKIKPRLYLKYDLKPHMVLDRRSRRCDYI